MSTAPDFEPTSDTAEVGEKSPIEFIAEAFWEDFVAQRPINGGMLWEDKLRQCSLDDSMFSLQRVDDLLDELRLQWSGKEALFAQDERNRNLLLFIGFYIGRVLSQAWQVAPKWLSQHEIATRYPHLNLQQDSLYHFMALDYLPPKYQTSHASRHLFFVIEPIASRLFGNHAKLATSVHGDAIDSGAFDAVFRHLPPAKKEDLLEQIPVSKPTQKKALPQPSASSPTHSIIKNINGTVANQQSDISEKTISERAPHNNKDIAQNIHHHDIGTAVTHKSETQETNKLTKTSVAAPVKVKKRQIKRQDEFSKLRDDLKNIKVAQTDGETDYQHAQKVLEQFDQYIATQCHKGKTLEQITFREQHQQARRQALARLSKSVKLGNTDAMLRLAIHYFLGEGLEKDEKKGVALIQKATRTDDSRAQRQLSRLYYQGLGVPQDTVQGLHWLETAADNDHPEAKEVLEQWHNSQTVIDERKYDVTTDRRYAIWVLLALIIAVVIFLLV